MSDPGAWEFAGAWLAYQRSRLRARWRLSTGRCPSCPKTRRGPHKFGCSRAATALRFPAEIRHREGPP